jgi:hypothetical protein
MFSRTMLSTLALALLPLLSHCAPLTDDDKAGLVYERDGILMTQAQAATALIETALTTTATVISAVSPLAAVTTTPQTVYTIPPEAIPTRPASSQAPSASASPQPDATSIAATTKPLVMAYYPDWASFDPEKIDFKRFDWVDFAFAVPARNLTLQWDDPEGPDKLRRLVGAAHAGGAKVKLSIGGWSGSKCVTGCVATPPNYQ